jgi:hypothetical protein
VPVAIQHADGTTSVKINERQKPTPFAFSPVGEYRFIGGQRASVAITNHGGDGTVLFDSVRRIGGANSAGTKENAIAADRADSSA